MTEKTIRQYQAGVRAWAEACFGRAVADDKQERADRLLEEVFELLQSLDYDQSRIAAIRNYTFSREKGEPVQEMGGVLTTLAAFAAAHGIDMQRAGEDELARVWTRIEKIRAKQAAKPTGSALPMAWDDLPIIPNLDWDKHPDEEEYYSREDPDGNGLYLITHGRKGKSFRLLIGGVKAPEKFRTAGEAMDHADAHNRDRVTRSLQQRGYRP